jgi:hypothetical protein
MAMQRGNRKVFARRMRTAETVGRRFRRGRETRAERMETRAEPKWKTCPEPV